MPFKIKMERLIVEFHLNGLTQDEIARKLHCGKRRVNNTLKRFADEGKIPSAMRRGAPVKITDDIIEFIEVKTLQDASLTNGDIKKLINDIFKISISEQSVSNVRADLHFKYSPPKVEQNLTQKHREDRKAFCQKMLGLNESLKIIAFSDESRFVLGDDKKWVWVRKGEYTKNSTITSVKFPQSVMIFAVIAVGYKSQILIVNGSINSEKYIENCELLNFIGELNAFKGEFQWIFMQDGATCHTAEKSMDYLEGNCDVITDWPANSPDLNPIEILWAILKSKVSIYNPSTKQELIELIKRTWDEIPQTLIDKLCLSFEGRLRLCLEMEGDSISRFLSLSEGIKSLFKSECYT